MLRLPRLQRLMVNKTKTCDWLKEEAKRLAWLIDWSINQSINQLIDRWHNWLIDGWMDGWRNRWRKSDGWCSRGKRKEVSRFTLRVITWVSHVFSLVNNCRQMNTSVWPSIAATDPFCSRFVCTEVYLQLWRLFVCSKHRSTLFCCSMVMTMRRSLTPVFSRQRCNRGTVAAEIPFHWSRWLLGGLWHLNRAENETFLEISPKLWIYSGCEEDCWLEWSLDVFLCERIDRAIDSRIPHENFMEIRRLDFSSLTWCGTIDSSDPFPTNILSSLHTYKRIHSNATTTDASEGIVEPSKVHRFALHDRPSP